MVGRIARYGRYRRRVPAVCKGAEERAAGTIHRELGTLSAALRYCVAEGYLSAAPPVWLPQKGPARERWLTRNEAASLLWAARQEPQARLYLPLFVLIGLYTGARKEAIISLQ